MPVIPFNSASRAAGLFDDAAEIRAEEEAQRYRDEADAKLKRLQAQGVKKFDPNGGQPMIDIPERITDGWTVNAPGVETPNPYRVAETSFADLTKFEDQQGETVGGLSSQEIADLKKWRDERDRNESDMRMRQTLGAVDKSPDDVAKTLDLANRTGANRLEVQENLKSFQQSDSMSRIEALRQSAPKLRSWLDEPVNLELAHDDTESLGWWEQVQKTGGDISSGIGGSLAAGYVRISEGIWGLGRMASEGNDAFASWVAGREIRSGVSDFLTGQQASAKKIADDFRPDVEDPTARAALQGVESLPVSAAAITATILSGGAAAPGLLVMGGTTAGSEYGTARDQGMSWAGAAGYGAGQGYIEAATELLPMKWLVGDLVKETPFVKTLLKQQLAEGVTEQVATHSQDFLSWAVLPENADKTINDYIAERGPAAYDTLVASLVGSGIQTSVAQAADTGLRTLSESYQQKRAEDLARFIQALSDNAKDSKLLTRLPDKYREAVAAITKDGPVENIRVQSEAFTELAQTTGVGVDQLAKVFNVDAEQVAASIANGEDVVIPSGNYAAALHTAKKEIGITGESIHSAFAPNIRLRADDFTAKEQAAMKQVFQAEQEARTRAAETDQTFADSADRVREAIREQVVATGMYSTDVANTQAEIVSAMVTTLAERTGQDPEALWKEQGFDIIASVSNQRDDGALEQSVARTPNPPSDFDLKWAAEDLEPKQFEAWKAAREGLSNEQIAARMNEVEADAIYTPKQVSMWLLKAREHGYDSEKAATRVKAPETQRIIELRARGRKNADIAQSVYPDVDTQTALNRVKALASKNKAKIEERKAALEGAKSLAQGNRRTPRTVDDVMVERASIELTPGEFEAWKAANEGLSNEEIAIRLGGSEGGSVESVRTQLKEARRKGFDVERVKSGGSISQETLRVLELKAQGLPNRVVAERVYPERDRADAARQVSVLADRHRQRIEAMKSLAQETGGTFTPREDRSIIRLFEKRNLATLAHEGAHWYLDTLWRMGQTENPHPFVLEQLSSILEWHGKSPNWTAMFNSDGSFTQEGVDLQEAFAETFEAYLREGKAPSVGMRAVFAAFKQWLLRAYKAVTSIGNRVNLNDEIRQVFDRMLVTDEAIRAAQSNLTRDSEAMATALLEKGVITPKQFEKTKERIQAARERAEAALMSRLMDEYERSQKAWWNEEQRQTRREVASEIDERPEQRAFQVLSGVGWRDTREAAAEAALAEAEAMLSLAQGDGYAGNSVPEAAEWVAAREKGLDLSKEARAARAKQMGFTKRFYHETKSDPASLNEGFDTTRRQAATGDSIMPLGVFVKPGAGSIGIGATQVELLVRLGNTRTFADRAALEAHLRNDAEYARLADEVAAINAQHKATFAALEAAWDKSKRLSPEWHRLNDQIIEASAAWEAAVNVAGEDARVRATEVLKAEGLNSITVTKDVGSFSRAVKTTVVLDPKDLRSPDAAFDPDETNSARLLAHGADGYAGGFVEQRHVDMNATDESLMALRSQMMADGRVPLILLFKTTEGRIIAFPGVSGDYGLHHDQARDMLGLGDLKLRHGVYNPRKWPTIAEMNASDTAWYDTTGTQEDGAGSLAQSQTHDPKGERELDALGFYSAVFEAAKSVRPDVWSMGWDHARNSIVKGGAKINGQRVAPRETEMAYLGLDEMFYGTKLKGAELAEAVLSHIQAKRLELVQNFARFDPNNTSVPSKKAMLAAMSPEALSGLLNVDFQNEGDGRGRIVSDVGNPLYLYIERVSEVLASPTIYNLMQPQTGGAPKLIATGALGDLDPIVGKMLYEANPERAARRIGKDDLAEAYQEGMASGLVRGAGDIRLPGEDVPLFEMVIGLPPGVPGSDYQAPRSHVGGKMQGTLVTAHGEERIDDKGQRTVFVGQVQSDMAQEMRGAKELLERNDRALKRVIEESGIVDRPSAIAWMASQGAATQNGMEEYSDERLIGLARQNWAGRNGIDYGYGRQVSGALQNMIDAPLNSTSEWTNVAVRSMIYRAAREGFLSISFPTAETSEIIQGNDDAAQHYETNVKGALEKIAKQLGGEVRKGAVKYSGMSAEWENLPPESAEKVLASLWSRLPPAVRGTIRMNMPNMRKTEDGEFYVASTSRPGNDDSGVGKDTYEWTFAREAKRNPLIAAYQIWVQGAMIFGQPGAFEKLITAAGGPKGSITEALEQAIAEGEPASAYILDITPAMRAKIVTEGFPLFHTRTGRPATTTPPTSIPPMRLNLQAVLEQYGEKALADLPPEVAAHAMQGSDVEQFVELARNVRKSLGKKHPKSLWKFLSTSRQIGSGNDKISYRGIRDDGGELIKIIGEKKAAPGLISEKDDAKNVRSYTIEHAAHVAWEAGYFNGEGPPGPAEFLDALRADLDESAKLYSRDDLGTVAEIKNAEEWASWFDQNEVDIRAPVAELREKLAIVATSQGSNAISPDEAAPFFKMRDGAELLAGLKQGQLRDKLIRDETNRRMIERHGDIFKTGKVMEEAQVYARNEIQHRQFEIELDALAQATGQQAASNLAKQQAIENLRSKQVREVLNYNQWLTLERRWAQKAVEAAGKGDMAKAQEYARYRLINSHMYTEGKKLAERIEKTRKHLLAYDSKTKLARLYAAGTDYADQMKGLLSDYQLRNESRKAESGRASRAVWLQAQMAGIDPFAAYGDPTKTAQEQQVAAAEAIERSTMLARLAEGVDATNYKSITVEELEAVRDEADLIWKLATLKDRLIKEGERRRLSLAGDDIAAEIEANQPNPKPPEPIETDTPGEKLKSGPKKYFAMHRTLQSLAHQFAGGKDGGVFWRYIVRPLNEAFSRLSSLRKEMGADVATLFSVYTKAEQERFYRDRRHFKGIGRSLTTQGRLAIALNWGNAKNRKRIMDAYGWDEAQVQEVLDSLDKRDWDFVQSVWNYMNEWFPEANRVHEAVHGAPMTKEDPIQVATRFGVYAGGYYPIKFDPMLSSKAGQRAVEADAQKQTGRVGVRTKEGFTKKRVSGKVTMPLRLSALDVISQHLDEVAKSIATEETLFDVGRILKQPQVEDAIVQRHGRQIYNTIVNQVVTAKFGMEGTSGLLAHLRNGATVVGLSWKVATASLQVLGASNSIVRVGSTWMAKGYARMGKDAVTLESSARWIMERSEFMRHRREQQSPEMSSLLDAMKTKWTPDFIARVIPRELRGAHNWFVKNGFALMANVQFYSVDMPTWYGAYFKAQNDGAAEGDAIAMADQAVIDAQGGGELHQLAAMQSGAGTKYAALLRVLTNFMSYMVTTYNLGVQRVRNARTTGQIAALALDFVLLAVIPVAGKMLIDALTRGVGGDDEPEEWAERYAREQLAFVFGPFLGISQFAGSVRGDDAFGYSGPAGFAIFNEMNKLGIALAEGDFDGSFWRPANRALGMVFHYPAGQIDASVRGALSYFNGETDNPAAFFFGPTPAN